MHPKYLAASISIHAAREGGDIVARFVEAEFRISIHAAREGGDKIGVFAYNRCGISIHAAREGGDNLFGGRQTQRHVFQSTPPVKAATDFPCSFHPSACISIHAAREGGDAVIYNLYKTFRISIHAAREGGDCLIIVCMITLAYFNPRRP